MRNTVGTLNYPGSELDLFRQCIHWKAYIADILTPYLTGEILEIGAGIGGTTRRLRAAPGVTKWTALEPDPQLARVLQHEIPDDLGPTEVIVGTLDAIPPVRSFDVILYIDVLEHIQDDRGELRRVVDRLRVGGRVCVAAPAHNILFSPFDAAIGHYRRYTRSTLAAAAPPRLILEACFYLDAVGMLASLANRVLLRQSMPTSRQLKIWDRVLVRASRVLDPLVGWRLGKTVIATWRLPRP